MLSFAVFKTGSAQADAFPILLSATLGGADVRRSTFEASLSANLALGIDLSLAAIDVGYLALGRFESKKAAESNIEVEGFILSIAKGLPLFDILHLDFKGGLFRWRAEARFLGNPIGSDTGSAGWGSAVLRF